MKLGRKVCDYNSFSSAVDVVSPGEHVRYHPGMRWVAVVVALCVTMTACAEPFRPGLTQEALSAPVYDGPEPSGEAYGWVNCSGTLGLPRLDRAPALTTRAAGMYDPVTESGFRVLTKSPINAPRSELVNGKIVDPSRRGETADTEAIILRQLRSVDSVRSLFDFESFATDVMVPSNSGPEVQVLPTPAGSEILRLEGLPIAWPTYWVEEDPAGFSAVDVFRPAPSAFSFSVGEPWLLDVWTDGDQVTQLRFQTQATYQGRPSNLEPLVSEIRFVDVADVLDDGVIQLPDCPEDPTASTDGWFDNLGWSPTRRIPLDVSLDADGRPYDVSVPSGSTIFREPIGKLTAEGGELLVMDGISAQMDPLADEEEAVPISVEADRVDELGIHYVNLEMIRHQGERNGRRWVETLGVWVGPTDAQVASWDPFEDAYATEGITGGIIAARSVRDIKRNWYFDQPVSDLDYYLVDVDGRPGTETFTFTNGRFDGFYPMSRGRNAENEVVAVVIWRTDAPWRLAVPTGAPPADVTEREEQLIECIAGEREIYLDGTCLSDEES